MGLDGGTIITRNDVLRRSSSALNAADDSRSSRGGAVRGIHRHKKLDARTSKVTRWSTCALTSAPLVPPIVACFLGRLYNKAAVLELLLARAGSFADEAAEHRYLNQLRLAGDAYDHITSTRDVFPLQYKPAVLDAAPVATDTAGGADAELPAPYACPIAHVRCDRHPFMALAPCGHVLSERALKETRGSGGNGGGGGSGSGVCPLCSTAYDAALDVVPLLPEEEQMERLRELLPLRRKQKKKRKRAAGEAAGEAAAAADGAAGKVQGDQQQAGQQQQQQQQQAGSSPPLCQRQRLEQQP